MKPHLLFVLLLAWTLPVPRAAAERFPAPDKCITWIGRTETRGNDVAFDWSGVYAIVQKRTEGGQGPGA